MTRLETLQEKRNDTITKMRALLDSADAREDRSLTEDEEKQYLGMEASLAQIDKDVEREERLAAEEDKVKKPKNAIMHANIRSRGTHTPPEEFEKFGEFIWTVRMGKDDKRLNYVSFEKREQSMSTGVEGGFMVPEKFRPELLSVSPQQAIFRPRSRVIGAMDPPDSALTLPALNQTAAENIYGGIVVDWVAEGGTKPETDFKLLECKWEPKEVAGYLTTTDKLLRNWRGASPLIESQFRQAVIGSEENAFYNGSGVGRPLGILNAPARIDYARATANSITYPDCVGMYARLRFGGSPIWIASQTCIPQLCTMVDNTTGQHLVWQQSAVPGMPPTLMGIPVYFHERSVALGTKGDLILCDLSYYVIMDGSGPFVASSEHVYFTSNKTVIKIFWNVDGAPWLTGPIPIEGSPANTVSPFIVLN